MGCDHNHVNVKVVKASNPVRVSISKGSSGSTGDVDLSSVLGRIKKLESLPHLATEDVQVLINNSVERINMELSDEIYYLKESVKYFVTEEQVKSIINTEIGADVAQLGSGYADLFEEQELINRSIQNVKTDLNGFKQSAITEQQVQNLIDTALSKLVNAEEVRY